MMSVQLRELAVILAVSGCNVPEPPAAIGSLPLDAEAPPGDAAIPLDGGAVRACGRGIVVVESDYASTNVALLREDGLVHSESIASSATASVGLTAPLSGDVVVPTMRVQGKEIVLIDRDPGASRLVWVDIEKIGRRELSVGGSGFYADPYDFVQFSATKAYVTRFGSNPVPGQQPFDRGSDLLVVDPSVPRIVASIDMTPALGADASRVLPRPGQVVVVGARAFVLLGALPLNVLAIDVNIPSRLVTMDTTTEEIMDVLVVEGLANCTGIALSPTGQELSVLCSGKINDLAPSDPVGSGIARVDLTSAPRVVKTWKGRELGPGPVGFHADYAAPSALVFETLGYKPTDGSAAQDDTVARLDLETGSVETILKSAGEAFTLGGIACDALCRVCFAADAKRQGGVVHRFAVDEQGHLGDDRAIKVETRIGLPPRYLGRF
jgi:hypothetical protein